MLTLLLSTALVLAACAIVLSAWNWSRDDATPPAAAPAPACPTAVRVVTASAFAPVLSAIAPAVADGEDCARLEVTVADGREAAGRIVNLGADVWIPDDTSWVSVAGEAAFAKATVGGSGTVVATSPFYFVTDQATADRVTAAGGSWLGLADLVTGGSGVRLVVRDPASSGDGLLAAGAIGEAVWLKSGMNASSEALVKIVPATRTVEGMSPALPSADGEVGLVPEYELLGQAAAARSPVVLAPTDFTAMLRYTWLPLTAAADDGDLPRAMDRVLRTLVGRDASGPLAAAGLRAPGREPPDAVRAKELPSPAAPPFEVLGKHHVDHVFATWYTADRRSDVLVVVDVSGSMAEPAPDSDRSLIELVAAGCEELGKLLPDDAQLSLWEFGSRLDPPKDHRMLLPRGLMTAEHRQALAGATQGLAARQTGTGLHDTLLAAYLAGRDGYRPGTPNQVVLFTDGRNEDDPDSITADELGAKLKAAQDPRRPVQLTVVMFGTEPEVDVLAKALKPIGGYVDHVVTAEQVRAVFIHVAAGGLHS